MAIQRPLTFQSDAQSSGKQGMREMSDSEMGLLRYNLACAYSDALNNGISTVGAIATGTGKADIFNPFGDGVIDTKRNFVEATNTAGGNEGEDYPAYPAVTTTVVSTTRWQQNFDSVSYPTNATIDSDSYLYYTDNAFDFRYTSLEADFLSTIIDDTMSEMRTGHGIGTYYISTVAPFYLGAGTWTDKGTVMTDTTYDAGSTAYKLWLKRDLTDSSSYTNSSLPMYRFKVGSAQQGFNEIDVGKSGSLIQNVLLPIMKRNASGTGKLQYSVSTSSSGLPRGTMLDKRQEGYTESRTYSHPLYYSRRTPSGPTSTITTYYLNLT